MQKRPLYLLALSLAMTAILAGVAAQRCSAQAASAAARAAAARREEDRKAARNESRFYVREHRRISACALGVSVVGLGAWFFSLQRREPGCQSVPLVLFLSAAVVQLLLA